MSRQFTVQGHWCHTVSYNEGIHGLVHSSSMREFANCVIKEWNPKNTMLGIFYEIRGRHHCLFKQGFGPLRKALTPLSSTDKSHYLPPSQVLPSLRRHLHSGSTYARDLSKTKATICLTWESHMCRKPDSLVSFLSYILLYLRSIIYFFFLICCSQRQDNTSDVISCLVL